jgi:L-rhamnose isomerase
LTWALKAGEDYTQRLALLMELKAMPFGSARDFHYREEVVAVGLGFMDEIRNCEKCVLSQRTA